MRDKQDAREQLRRSVDLLANRANLYAQMQKDPLKMIGGASGVGLVLGVLVGRRFARTRKIFVRPEMSKKEQKAYEQSQKRAHQAQQAASKGGLRGALLAAVTTLVVKTLQERVLAPQIERFADELQHRASNAGKPAAGHEHGPRRPM